MKNEQHYRESTPDLIDEDGMMPILCEVVALVRPDHISSFPVPAEDVIAICAASIDLPARPIALAVARALSSTSNAKVLLAEFPLSPKAHIKVSTSYSTGLARNIPHHDSSPQTASKHRAPSRWLQAAIGPVTEAHLVVADAPAASDPRFPAVLAAAKHVVVTFPATFAGLRALSAHMRLLSHLAQSATHDWQTICALPIIPRNDPGAAFVVRLAEIALGPEFLLPGVSAGETDETAYRHLNSVLLERCGFAR